MFPAAPESISTGREKTDSESHMEGKTTWNKKVEWTLHHPSASPLPPGSLIGICVWWGRWGNQGMPYCLNTPSACIFPHWAWNRMQLLLLARSILCQLQACRILMHSQLHNGYLGILWAAIHLPHPPPEQYFVRELILYSSCNAGEVRFSGCGLTEKARGNDSGEPHDTFLKRHDPVVMFSE